MGFDWKKTVAAVAPLVGTAIGGPFGNMAAGLVTTALGIPKDSTDGQIAEAVKNATPDQLLAIKNSDHQFKKDMAALGIKESQLFTERTTALEGTAADLKSLAYFGPLVIFARGCQRPIWGFGTLYMDFMVFGGDWVIEEGTRQDSAFLVINLLVLGFLFGERAVKNLAPLIERLLKK